MVLLSELKFLDGLMILFRSGLIFVMVVVVLEIEVRKFKLVIVRNIDKSLSDIIKNMKNIIIEFSMLLLMVWFV